MSLVREEIDEKMDIEALMELKKSIEGKKIILFGAGNSAEKLWYWLDLFSATENILFCVDNNKAVWGELFLNRYEIKNPKCIEDIDRDMTMVLVASYYFEEILQQIHEIGDYSVYNAYPNCNWILKELIDIYKDKKILLLVDTRENHDNIVAFKEIMSLKLDLTEITEKEIDRFPLSEFENKVFWIASMNHVKIEEKLEKIGYKVNADFYTITHFVFPGYCYLKGKNKDRYFSKATGKFDCKDLGEYFCAIPFERLYLYSTNSYLCCSSHCNSIDTGNIQERNGIEDLWNGATAKTFRASILSGSYGFCNNINCPHLYTIGSQKKDNVSDPFYRKIIDENLLEIKGGPSYLNIGIDSMCNLRCKMCGDKSVRKPDETKEKLDEIVNKLKEYQFENLKTLFMAGSGEVFLNPIYIEILNKLDQFYMPNLEKIIIKSNGVLLDHHIDLIKKLSKRYKIVVSISIDGISPETYHMIRRGSNYSKLFQNMALLSELKKENYVCEIEYSFCIQRDNFRELVSLMDMANKYNADRVLLQQVMLQLTSESVQSEDNVYYETFVEILNKAYKKGISLGLNVDPNSVKKYIINPR